MKQYWWLIMIDDTENPNPVGEWDIYVVWYNIPKLIYKWIKVYLSNVNYLLTLNYVQLDNQEDLVDEYSKFVLVDNWKVQEKKVMKKYRVNVVGTKYVTTDTEDKAIEHTQDMLDHIHKSLNMQVFSIAEVREEQ